VAFCYQKGDAVGVIRVFLVDDHAILRDGLTSLINAQDDMEVVGEANDGRDIVRRVQDCQPNIVVMDVSMPNLGGAQATTLIRQQCPEVQIIALTRHRERGYIHQMMQAGVCGYVLKHAAAQELLTAIHAVAAGNKYLDSSLLDRALDAFIGSQTQPTSIHARALSEREVAVVQLFAHGYSNKEIAAELGISIKTIDTYKARAMEKLELYTRAALVRYAVQQGWLNHSSC
jgi:DNA-binding NarL/FixJ family response regulator